ncbi:MAG: hypothetical protein DMG14_08355 [Acidobacteria bacterium]|nr:MAG: hypothetical protein DMG14_08355 [Acidobacteriota bacterium]
MHLEFPRFALACLACVVVVTLGTAVSAAQKQIKVKPNPPASPQAKTSQPATHFTQGTITSIEANQLVITRKIRGKAEQVSFQINSQTQRSGNLVAGNRVSVQYREADHQNIAATVRELPQEAAAKSGKTAYKPRPKG